MSELKNQYEQELFSFLAIPSVSAQKEHFEDCIQAAQFVQNSLLERGFNTEIRETGPKDTSFPAVIGKWQGANAKASDPTLLIYGHYDVQPPEPLKLWHSPPFSPTVRDGKVYARGATDDKGQILALICGMGEFIQKKPGLPLKIIFLIEGEEEIGSPNLKGFIEQHKEEFQCNCVLISDSPQLGLGQPAICYGLKGLTYFELHIQGPQRDLHSGSFGGLVQNPCLALSKILTSLCDQDGRILIRQFYDDVIDLSKNEREMMASLPLDEKALQIDLGIDEFFGEKNYSPRERRWARPTFDIHGISGGYQNEGAKTVIPSNAFAKFGFRLVADQNPDNIGSLVRRHIEETIKKENLIGCSWNLKSFHSANPVLMDWQNSLMNGAKEAIKESFGQEPVFIREGGSIPVVEIFQKELKALPLLIGLGLPGDGAHAPNEHFTLADFHKGIHLAKILPEKLQSYF